MGKGGSILGIIGIILGAGGLGFGFMMWNTQNSMQANLVVQDIWSQYDGDSFTVNPSHTYLQIPNMSIVFDSATTASINILFTCSVVIVPNPSGYSGISFYFNVDGIRLLQPKVDIGSYEGSSTVDFYSVALQHFIPSISSGTHNVTLIVYSEATSNYVRYCSLTIQSFAD
ncbi:MAG: hypothetical protein KGD74_06150 [Candidatus Lokiarchaeota archaeon]|nr:hypothetical protein [Candidatus Lokiarchaeota archaeon]